MSEMITEEEDDKPTHLYEYIEYTGVICKWVKSKKYGFIHVYGHKGNVYVHGSDIEWPYKKNIKVGDEVSFFVYIDKTCWRRKALQVRVNDIQPSYDNAQHFKPRTARKYAKKTPEDNILPMVRELKVSINKKLGRPKAIQIGVNDIEPAHDNPQHFEPRTTSEYAEKPSEDNILPLVRDSYDIAQHFDPRMTSEDDILSTVRASRVSRMSCMNIAEIMKCITSQHSQTNPQFPMSSGANPMKNQHYFNKIRQSQLDSLPQRLSLLFDFDPPIKSTNSIHIRDSTQ